MDSVGDNTQEDTPFQVKSTTIISDRKSTLDCLDIALEPGKAAVKMELGRGVVEQLQYLRRAIEPIHSASQPQATKEVGKTHLCLDLSVAPILAISRAMSCGA